MRITALSKAPNTNLMLIYLLHCSAYCCTLACTAGSPSRKLTRKKRPGCHRLLVKTAISSILSPAVDAGGWILFHRVLGGEYTQMIWQHSVDARFDNLISHWCFSFVTF